MRYRCSHDACNAQVLIERPAGLPNTGCAPEGFTIVETIIALFMAGIGLLAIGQLIFLATGSASLARSKGIAALVAHNKLEFLADLCRRNPGSPELSVGSHGTEAVQFTGSGGAVLNRFQISWAVANLDDPRDFVRLPAKKIQVVVTPVDLSGEDNQRPLLNKKVTISAVFYTGPP